MLTQFGKFCRKLRIDNGELLKDMANKLEVTSSYLSAVENGKRNVPQEWPTKIIDFYELDQEQQQELQKVIQESKKELRIDFSNYDNEDKQVLMALAREFKDMDQVDKDTIKSILLSLKNKE
ncbi:helix-turn-helix domain-containing protein [Solibacillus silvestris]|uniref:helix-turn-helix domain-containing protein n=1 Tax=Solibacillus silvestris TaxID=76853 RepID=UPI003F80D238